MLPRPATLAVGLVSGGLDSTLAVKLILGQGIDVVGFNLHTPFHGGADAGGAAARSAAELGIELVTAEAGRDYVEMIRRPRFGHGTALNPCIDCHIYMLRRAADLMRERGATFCFTGEVLGQRPMSQRLGQLEIIERESGLGGRLLRPLSARLLPPTVVEEEGLVDRSRLLDIEGRTRKRQLALAEDYGLTEYTSPAGGCLLTDRQFAARLDDAFAHGDVNVDDIILLKLGRHYRLPSGAKAVVGRNHEDNERILEHLAAGDAAFEIIDTGSPVALLRPAAEHDWPAAAALTLRHSDARGEGDAHARVWTAAGEVGTITARLADAEGAKRIGAPTK